jgi:hypothetical protein
LTGFLGMTERRGDMSNINGKAYAINVITPMKPWTTWLLRGFFFSQAAAA